jgi:hypothetical protein
MSIQASFSWKERLGELKKNAKCGVVAVIDPCFYASLKLKT